MPQSQAVSNLVITQNFRNNATHGRQEVGKRFMAPTLRAVHYILPLLVPEPLHYVCTPVRALCTQTLYVHILSLVT